MAFRPLEPPEPPELVLVVFCKILEVLVVLGSGGSGGFFGRPQGVPVVWGSGGFRFWWFFRGRRPALKNFDVFSHLRLVIQAKKSHKIV